MREYVELSTLFPLHTINTPVFCRDLQTFIYGQVTSKAFRFVLRRFLYCATWNTFFKVPIFSWNYTISEIKIDDIL